MKLKNTFVVGLLTNLRWDWLNLIYLFILLRWGVGSKAIFMTRRAGGVRQNVIFDDKGWRGGSQKGIFDVEGGGVVQTPPKKDDIIYEQPLLLLYMSRSGYPPWILKVDGLQSSGHRLISSIGKTKSMAFFWKKNLIF